MKYIKKFVLAVACMLPLSVFAQDIIISGHVVGYMRTHAALINANGDTLAAANAVRGKFLLASHAPADIYTLSLSPAWQRKVLLVPGDTIKLTGYLDGGSASASQLQITRLESDNKLNKALQAVDDAVKAYTDNAFKVTDGLAEPMRTNRLNEIIAADDSARAEALISQINVVGDPLAAAALCEAATPLQYENTIRVWNRLSAEAKSSAPGQRLAAIVARQKRIANGALAPDITLTDRNGKAVALSSLKGKPVVVDFWASWCGPCRKEMQYLKALYKELGGDKTVTFVSISLDDDSTKWRRADADEAIVWHSWWDKGGFNGSVARKAYGFNQIPFLVLIDSDGHIVGKNLRRGRLRNALNFTLKK